MASKKNSLSQDALKLIAVVSMTIDHIGVYIFPSVILLRIIGRLAFPIFAYSIYSGCKYTRHHLQYFLRVAGIGVGYMIVHFFYTGEIYGNILVTFAFSIAILICLKQAKSAEGSFSLRISFLLLAFTAAAGAFALNKIIGIDYGLTGCLLPLFAAVGDVEMFFAVKSQAENFTDFLPLAFFSVGLVLVCLNYGGIQYYSLLSLPLLALSNGKRRVKKLKYFFYIYYPAHLVVLETIKLIIDKISS